MSAVPAIFLAADATAADPSDEALAIAAAADDRRAFEQLVARYQVPLLRMLLRLTPSRADAEDVLQETFVKLYVARRTFAAGRRFRTWAFTIARRAAIDHARSRASRPTSPLVEPAASNTSDPSRHFEAQDERQSLWSLARRTLGDDSALALWLVHVESMPVADAGRVIGRSWLATKTLLMRSRRRLAQALETRGRP